MNKKVSSLLLLIFFTTVALAQPKNSRFKIIAFYTGKSDLAHISFVKEANQYFPKIAVKNNFSYDYTSNWENLNSKFLSKYQVVLFLDTRPEQPEQREAFQKYMENGGAWMGFHFSTFALEKSAYDMNWNWYHNTFLGSGSYGSNTWRPTSAVLKVEDKTHPVVKNLPETFKVQPNEWYSWQNDLRKNSDIKILLAIDSTSFPLGTGPKTHEIWQDGYYPVVWTNKNYKMVYVNMGHNDMDYEHKYDNTNKTISYTFDNEIQNKMILNSVIWLGTGKKVK
ncbi:ThuA domain-containing protein [Pedobacter aquatilis]|uniref:ThuA domain-containing protein n=1 Tax=Pedobacter aquatilis TaxID=351343 RepID=UPI0025B2894D|nr:ThuA domain-containing protein [Pedobacter aquatilis]MDN3586436.1 ThuA domain-containing protein [Pedobacter aquatilis]